MFQDCLTRFVNQDKTRGQAVGGWMLMAETNPPTEIAPPSVLRGGPANCSHPKHWNSPPCTERSSPGTEHCAVETIELSRSVFEPRFNHSLAHARIHWVLRPVAPPLLLSIQPTCSFKCIGFLCFRCLFSLWYIQSLLQKHGWFLVVFSLIRFPLRAIL